MIKKDDEKMKWLALIITFIIVLLSHLDNEITLENMEGIKWLISLK
ncbi:hypothetical protein BRO54_0040 [Geobacillus proteiniphilus]|uniref:Uncharacterized protein n=1 Tax=Geobacillus proteiniphilus TaxID=860353 RepID=A0A1Q5T9V0_9BACL|nr:hypothetical protein BRO54_0040 [Geobacillus proteiniphilus]